MKRKLIDMLEEIHYAYDADPDIYAEEILNMFECEFKERIKLYLADLIRKLEQQTP